jgi:hypothetical protein
MSQSLATAFGRVPNVFQPMLASYGTLVIRDHNGLWHYFGKEWKPAGRGLTNAQFIKLFHVAPPSNVPMEGWGIVEGLTDDNCCRDDNWDNGELQGALDQFLDSMGVRGDGHTMRGLSKAVMLKAKQTRRQMMNNVVPAPDPVAKQRVKRGHRVEV